jgi:hypothetical protein
MALYVVPRPDPKPEPALRDADAESAFDDTIPEGVIGAPLDVDELEDTQPMMVLDVEDEFSDAPTMPDIRRVLHGPLDDRHWERVLRAVADAVRRVFAHQAG